MIMRVNKRMLGVAAGLFIGLAFVAWVIALA